MNSDFQNLHANARIAQRYTENAIVRAVAEMGAQRHADMWCEEAAHDCRAMCANIVFDESVQARYRALIGSAAAVGVGSAAALYVTMPVWQGGAITPLDMLLSSLAAFGGITASTLLWHAWKLRSGDGSPRLTIEQVEEVLQLVEVTGERHKQPPSGWERGILAFGNSLECAGFAWLALAGLSYWPPAWAAIGAVAIGLAVTGSVASLGKLHAQRAVILQGREMYRRVEQLAQELKAASDPEAPKYAEHAVRLREALWPANRVNFEAMPSRGKLAATWALLILLAGGALALRIVFGSDMGLAAIIGAGMLSAGAAVIFMANYRASERSLSVAGDAGQRAMKIARLFPTAASFKEVAAAHKQKVSLFFRKAVSRAAQLHERVLNARDPRRPRLPLEFALPDIDPRSKPAADVGESPTPAEVPSGQRTYAGWQAMAQPTMIIRRAGADDGAR
jgi:hypothetical protein